MRILMMGGTGFIGPHAVRRLSDMGHEVTIFHRGQTEADLPPEVRHIHGDRQRLADFAAEFKRVAPHVVLDMIPGTEQDARTVMSTVKGITHRVVAISSIDVYRAYGQFLRTEPGPIDPVPLSEDAPLRENLYPLRGKIEGVDDHEKILVERVVMGDPDLPGTVLRLPMVYGPQDGGRLFEYLMQMDDRRPAI